MITLARKLRSAARHIIAQAGVEVGPAGPSQGGNVINNGEFWDNYVKNWPSNPEHAGLKFIGEEWKNQEIFTGFL